MGVFECALQRLESSGAGGLEIVHRLHVCPYWWALCSLSPESSGDPIFAQTRVRVTYHVTVMPFHSWRTANFVRVTRGAGRAKARLACDDS